MKNPVTRLAALAAVLVLVVTGCGTVADAGQNQPKAAAKSKVTAPAAKSGGQNLPKPVTAAAITARMNLRGVTVYTAATDPNQLIGRNHGYTSKAAFGPGRYSSVEVFSSASAASARLAYVKAFTCPIGDGYDYLDGTALLRLGCSYTPAKARVLRAGFLAAESGS